MGMYATEYYSVLREALFGPLGLPSKEIRYSGTNPLARYFGAWGFR
jgi:hypothetical protein